MKKRSNKKIFIIIAAVVIVAVLIVLAMNTESKKHGTKVATELVQNRTIIESVSANGKIQPEKDISITPYISGEVVELNVKEGDDVETGDVLAKIDPEIYISTVERLVASLNTQKANQSNAKARVSQVKAQYVNAEASYRRSKQLYEQDVISQADYDAALAQFEVAKAEVDAANESLRASQYAVGSSEASLKEAKENLRRTTIYAPNAGTVSKLNVEKGERVMGASQFSAGSEIMRLANLTNMEVNVEVNENDIVRVSMYDTAIIEVDAYINKKFKGVVTEIATSANTVGVSADQVTNFDVKIRILHTSYADMIPEDKPNYSPFRPGMSATVEIQTETAWGIVTVPIQAVTTRADTLGNVKSAMEEREEERQESAGVKIDEEVKEFVFIHDNGFARLREVKTGIQDNMYIQILEGLEVDEEVIVAPYRAVSKKLKHDDPVNKVDKKDLFSNED